MGPPPDIGLGKSLFLLLSLLLCLPMALALTAAATCADGANPTGKQFEVVVVVAVEVILGDDDDDDNNDDDDDCFEVKVCPGGALGCIGPC